MSTPVDLASFKRIRVLWPDHLGIARGKYLPSHLAAKGTGHAAAVYSLQYDRSFAPAPGSYILDGFPDLHATMDPDSLRAGWDDDRTGVAVADLTMHHEPFPFSARHALRSAIADWEALGYTPQVGLELEAYVCQPDGEGGWMPWDTPGSYVYGTGPLVDPVGLMDDIMDAAEGSGIPIESINAEFDNAQFELTLEYTDALRAADDAFLFRQLARERALAHGLRLTFMGQPFDELSGSGLHVNVSFLDAEGNNALADDGADDGLSELAGRCLAGLCQHHRALTALVCPTVNAYRRLNIGGFAGVRASWGFDHRAVGNRVPPARGAATRIENRTGDGAANIHTAIATVLQAARLGVEQGLDRPPPETGDGFDEVVTDVVSAANLRDALADLEADEALAKAVGADLVANFLFVKGMEWERFTEANPGWEAAEPVAVTDWEFNEYSNYH